MGKYWFRIAGVIRSRAAMAVTARARMSGTAGG